MSNAIEPKLTEVSVIGENRFILERELGRGGGAVVWKGRELDAFEQAGREVAVKVLTCAAADSRRERLLQEFANEARIWADFQKSSHVVQLYYTFRDLVQASGSPLIAVGFVMEYAPEGDLKKRLRREKSLQEALQLDAYAVKAFLRAIAEGVKAGHDLGIVHRDIKASNILLFREGTNWVPKVMDFGISAFLQSVGTPAAGTPEYMAPELLADPPADPSKQSDIFSLGIVFYELLAGRTPFQFPPTSDPVQRRKQYFDAYRTQEIPIAPLEGKADDAMRDFLLQMLNREHEKRPAISQVIRKLDKEILLEATTLAELPALSPVQEDTYRWNPCVHASLGEQLNYYLIRGRSPRGDPAWIANNLNERGVRGFAIYRVVGGYDYILRIWTSTSTDSNVMQVLSNFQAYQNGVYTRFSVKGIHILAGNVETNYFSAPRDESFIQRILSLPQRSPEEELTSLKNAGLVLGTLERNGDSSHPLRVFLTIQASEQMGEVTKKACARELSDQLRVNSPSNLSGLSVYHGDGPFQILVKFRLKSFEDLGPVYDRYLDIAAFLRTEHIMLSSQTYVELVRLREVGTNPSLPRSDDGRIMLELARLKHEM